MKKGGGSAFTIIIGPSKSVLIYALHSLENGPISGVCAKIIIIILEYTELIKVDFRLEIILVLIDANCNSIFTNYIKGVNICLLLMSTYDLFK